jgi:pSer/pThr/pTyr-binding forkhead associated (FHA) protein
MTGITFRVLDGADRGRVYDNLQAPVTIGREEGNTIQLNDERVSRFHAKIMKDHDRIVLTDLDSTNGTKVNNEDTQLRNLRPGDLIHIGRSVLLFGSREEIAQRLQRIKNGRPGRDSGVRGSKKSDGGKGSGADDSPRWQERGELRDVLFLDETPDLPDRLSPGQAAQLAELLTYLHVRIRGLLEDVGADPNSEKVVLDLVHWQNLIDLQSRLSEYVRSIGEPDQTVS